MDAIRRQAEKMEAAARGTDASVRKLLGDLTQAEAEHQKWAEEAQTRRSGDERQQNEDDDARRRFVRQIIQPGPVGLMDGSISTLAPVFAAASPPTCLGRSS